ncbi:MAG: ribonuclease domain-containing protein [Planctomycetota bacterium]
MSYRSNARNARDRGPKFRQWVAIAFLVGFAGVVWLVDRQQNEVAQQDNPAAQQHPDAPGAESFGIVIAPGANSPREVTPDDSGRDESVLVKVTPGWDNAPSRDETSRAVTISPAKSTTGPQKADSQKKTPPTTTKIENQTIKDFGRVVFTGTIDLQPTLDRIARGERNSHRNDGSTFGNRERRLPQKPSGYYTEYVHPTKDIGGPGPQRVIFGKGGDIWYTPDHYDTFKKIR